MQFADNTSTLECIINNNDILDKHTCFSATILLLDDCWNLLDEKWGSLSNGKSMKMDNIPIRFEKTTKFGQIIELSLTGDVELINEDGYTKKYGGSNIIITTTDGDRKIYQTFKTIADLDRFHHQIWNDRIATMARLCSYK